MAQLGSAQFLVTFRVSGVEQTTQAIQTIQGSLDGLGTAASTVSGQLASLSNAFTVPVAVQKYAQVSNDIAAIGTAAGEAAAALATMTGSVEGLAAALATMTGSSEGLSTILTLLPSIHEAIVAAASSLQNLFLIPGKGAKLLSSLTAVQNSLVAVQEEAKAATAAVRELFGATGATAEGIAAGIREASASLQGTAATIAEAAQRIVDAAEQMTAAAAPTAEAPSRGILGRLLGKKGGALGSSGLPVDVRAYRRMWEVLPDLLLAYLPEPGPLGLGYVRETGLRTPGSAILEMYLGMLRAPQRVTEGGILRLLRTPPVPELRHPISLEEFRGAKELRQSALAFGLSAKELGQRILLQVAREIYDEAGKLRQQVLRFVPGEATWGKGPAPVPGAKPIAEITREYDAHGKVIRETAEFMREGTRVTRMLKGEMLGLGEAQRSATASLSTFNRMFVRHIMWVGQAILIFQGLTAVTQTIREIISASIELDRVVRQVVTSLGEVEKGYQDAARAAITAASAQYGVPWGQAAGAVGTAERLSRPELARFGLGFEKIGGVPAERVVRQMYAMLQMFPGEEATRLADVITVAWQKSGASLSDFLSVLDTAAPTAEAFNMSLEDTITLMSFTARATGQSGDQLERLVRVMRTFYEQEGARRAVETAIGRPIVSPRGEWMPLDELLNRLARLDSETQKRISRFLPAQLGQPHQQYFLALLRQWDTYRDTLKDVQDAHGKFDEAVKTTLDATAVRIEKVKTMWKTLLGDMGKGVKDILASTGEALLTIPYQTYTMEQAAALYTARFGRPAFTTRWEIGAAEVPVQVQEPTREFLTWLTLFQANLLDMKGDVAITAQGLRDLGGAADIATLGAQRFRMEMEAVAAQGRGAGAPRRRETTYLDVGDLRPPRGGAPAYTFDTAAYLRSLREVSTVITAEWAKAFSPAEAREKFNQFYQEAITAYLKAGVPLKELGNVVTAYLLDPLTGASFTVKGFDTAVRIATGRMQDMARALADISFEFVDVRLPAGSAEAITALYQAILGQMQQALIAQGVPEALWPDVLGRERTIVLMDETAQNFVRLTGATLPLTESIRRFTRELQDSTRSLQDEQSVRQRVASTLEGWAEEITRNVTVTPEDLYYLTPRGEYVEKFAEPIRRLRATIQWLQAGTPAAGEQPYMRPIMEMFGVPFGLTPEAYQGLLERLERQWTTGGFLGRPDWTRFYDREAFLREARTRLEEYRSTQALRRLQLGWLREAGLAEEFAQMEIQNTPAVQILFGGYSPEEFASTLGSTYGPPVQAAMGQIFQPEAGKTEETIFRMGRDLQATVEAIGPQVFGPVGQSIADSIVTGIGGRFGESPIAQRLAEVIATNIANTLSPLVERLVAQALAGRL